MIVKKSLVIEALAKSDPYCDYMMLDLDKLADETIREALLILSWLHVTCNTDTMTDEEKLKAITEASELYRQFAVRSAAEEECEKEC